MKLKKLLLDITDTTTNLDIDVKGLCLHSTDVKKGDVFCALTNNLIYISQAIDLGARVILTTQEIAIDNCIVINNLQDKLPILAKRFYPQVQKAKIIAITGTNGKTTTALFITKTLQQLGKACGYIGTLGIIGSNFTTTVKNTTPDIFTIFKAINNFVENDIFTIVIEASSHGLVQGRVSGLNIEYAIFTNLTHDHLDYHKNFAEYKKAKQSLFEFKTLKAVIINEDDDFGRELLTKIKVTKHRYSINELKQKIPTESGFICQFDNHLFELPLLAEFNLMNVLAVIKLLQIFKYDLKQIIPLLSKITPIDGRMQRVENNNIWIDFAHTPDALLSSLTAFKSHFPDKKIRLVFGCGGNRDREKRAKMGKIAYENADAIIITNDNPRNEDPEDIIADIEKGMKDNERVQIFLNRKEAIDTAIANLTEDECVLIAGKGSEATQIIGSSITEFSDIAVVKRLLK